MTGGNGGALRMTGKGRSVRSDRIDLLFRFKMLCVSNINKTQL